LNLNPKEGYVNVARASLNPEKTPLKTELARLLATVQEMIQRSLVDTTRVLKRLAENK